MSDFKVPVGISNHHVHLCQVDLEKLFGKGHELTPKKDLSQPGQFASEEMVNLVGPKGTIARVRVLGPIRSQSQVEISRTDSYGLGIKAPVRESGVIAGTPGIILEGPAGKIELKEGVIIALRHLHLHTDEAKEMGLKDKDWVSIKFEGEREVTFGHVLVRVGPKYAKDFHVDTDEGNAAALNNGDLGVVIK